MSTIYLPKMKNLNLVSKISKSNTGKADILLTKIQKFIFSK